MEKVHNMGRNVINCVFVEDEDMESRNSYGWGYVGSNEKGFEWELIFGEKAHERIKSGYVYKTEEEALKEGKKFQSESNHELYKLGKLIAVKAEPLHFAY